MSRTAAEFLVESLEKTGVKRIYGVVGDSLNGFTDALRRRRRSTGCICGTRRLPPSPRAPRRISPASLRSAREAAVRATCISSTGFSIVIAAGSGAGHRGPDPEQRRSGVDYFQATHPEACSRNAAIIVEFVSNPGSFQEF